MSSSEAYDTTFVDISEFFSHGDSHDHEGDEGQSKSTFGEVDSPIKELKAIILSLDWEITDEIADSFVAEVDRLKEVWSSDKTVVAFIQILRALGKYLRTHKADAHPESVNLLYSVYNNFEKIVLTDEISEDQEEVILKEELNKFHALKEKIAKAAAAKSEGKANESLLSALKSILLEIDWQVTDKCMQKFDIEINKLERMWSTDKNFLTPLQMMRAIGKYINKNKLDSHPDSIKLLSNVFAHFETMALSEEMTPEEQQELIQGDLDRFHELKKHIAGKTAPQPVTPEDVIARVTEKEAPARVMPGQLTDDEIDTDEYDFGHVEPLSFDDEETIPSPAGLYGQPSETGEEVDSRLDDLFAGDEETDIYGGPAVTALSEEPAEVTSRLDDLFSENDEGIPVSSSLADGLEEIVPLPGGEQLDADTGFGDVTPLPAGGDFSEEETSFEEVTPLAMSTDEEVMPLPADGAYDADSESLGEVTPIEVTPLGGDEDVLEPQGPAKSADFIAAIESINLSEPVPDTTTIKNEIVSLQSELAQLSYAQMLLQIATWVTSYIDATRDLAASESLELLTACGKGMAKIEKSAEPNGPDSINLFQQVLEKFMCFQNDVMLPAHQALLNREKEIKKIIGVNA